MFKLGVGDSKIVYSGNRTIGIDEKFCEFYLSKGIYLIIGYLCGESITDGFDVVAWIDGITDPILNFGYCVVSNKSGFSKIYDVGEDGKHFCFQNLSGASYNIRNATYLASIKLSDNIS